MGNLKNKVEKIYGHVDERENEVGGLCDKMSFTAAEAYKMLRTKINLIVPQELTHATGTDQAAHKCRILGVTSSLRGEGKTTTSINMGYTFAEAGRKVCLIEADMRLPNINRRLGLNETPGLSNVLAGQCSIQDGLQRYSAKNGTKIFVMTAGDIPPTPSELLESKNMEVLLTELAKIFDLIIIDLPPVTAVTDALSVAPRVDGMILVVRQGRCDKRSLQDVLYQFSVTDTKILGIVCNCSDGPMASGSHYRRDKYYKTPYGKDTRGGGYLRAAKLKAEQNRGGDLRAAQLRAIEQQRDRDRQDDGVSE